MAEVWIGDDLPAAGADSTLDQALLRIRVDALEPDDRLAVSLNDVSLDITPAAYAFPDTRASIASATTTSAWTWEAQTLSGPGVWVELPLTSDPPHRGANRIGVSVATTGPGAGTRVVRLINIDVQVTYRYCGGEQLA